MNHNPFNRHVSHRLDKRCLSFQALFYQRWTCVCLFEACYHAGRQTDLSFVSFWLRPDVTINIYRPRRNSHQRPIRQRDLHIRGPITQRERLALSITCSIYSTAKMLWIFEISRYRLALAFKIMFYPFDSRRTSAAAGDGGLTFQTLRQNMFESRNIESHRTAIEEWNPRSIRGIMISPSPLKSGYFLFLIKKTLLIFFKNRPGVYETEDGMTHLNWFSCTTCLSASSWGSHRESLCK